MDFRHEGLEEDHNHGRRFAGSGNKASGEDLVRASYRIRVCDMGPQITICHQIDGSADGSEDSHTDRRKNDLDKRKEGYKENDKIPAAVYDGIGNDDALGSEGNGFCRFKLLGSLATKEGAHDSFELKVLIIQALAGNPEQIREMRAGDEGVQHKEAKCWEEPKSLMTKGQL
ncbi:hypothetical protein HOY82DRAFT_615814 [Tuber indicum]|nr:hypothetical protein HOY82DRAFT_615814 [Tuber indicum]